MLSMALPHNHQPKYYNASDYVMLQRCQYNKDENTSVARKCSTLSLRLQRCVSESIRASLCLKRAKKPPSPEVQSENLNGIGEAFYISVEVGISVANTGVNDRTEEVLVVTATLSSLGVFNLCVSSPQS